MPETRVCQSKRNKRKHAEQTSKVILTDQGTAYAAGSVLVPENPTRLHEILNQAKRCLKQADDQQDVKEPKHPRWGAPGGLPAHAPANSATANSGPRRTLK